MFLQLAFAIVATSVVFSHPQNKEAIIIGGAGGVIAAGGDDESSSSLWVSPEHPSDDCRYWCKTPEGKVYCCEERNDPISFPVAKQGKCPPVRPECPQRSKTSGPPKECSSDAKCQGDNKCCFDRCLNVHVCKPPIV